MFIGRERELQQLCEFQKRKIAGMIVCSGRRRIGKSTLIEHFAEGKRLLEFYGLAPQPNMTTKTQLEHFGQQLGAHFSIPAISFDNWSTALDTLAGFTREGPVIIFLDEISWMAGGDKDFPAKLKGIWDTKLKKNPELILILCGSVSSWIQENILEDKGFMGRISLTIDLYELSPDEANQFWLGNEWISAYEKFKLLCVTGGVPRYLEEINIHQTAEQNIKRMCFMPGGILVEEFNKIFKDLFGKKMQDYINIAKILVNSALPIEKICQIMNVKQTGGFNKKLKVLQQCGFISRDYVWSKGKPRLKLSKYRLSDNYLRFYLKYIDPKKELINKGLYHELHTEELDDWYSLMGLQFENMVLNNLPFIQKKLDISSASILSASSYYQNKTALQEACQIDLLIETKFSLYPCEIKFRKKIEVEVITEVMEKIRRIKTPKTISIRPVLIYQGELAESVKHKNFFSHIIRFEELLKSTL